MSHTSIFATEDEASLGYLDIRTIPIELVERVLTFCRPWDVAAFSCSCRWAHAIVYRDHRTDQYLWRELFLSHPFDDPRKNCGTQKTDPTTIHWTEEMTRRLKARWAAHSEYATRCQKLTAVETFVAVVHGASPAIRNPGTPHSYNIQWVQDVLRESDILKRDADVSPSECGLYAKLRSYIALSLDIGEDEQTKLKLRKRRNESRTYVYDVRNYTRQSWGPYFDDGRVDWRHLENLINVIVLNLRDLPAPWTHIRPPLGLEATRAYSAPGGCSSKEDWARVEGTWRRYVCFMDYRDLFAFNYSDLFGGKADPNFFDCPRFREATRLLEIKIRLITKDEFLFRSTSGMVSSNDGLPNADEKYPPLYFSGSSKGVKGDNAIVEGVVRMGPDGVVRWRFAFVYPGHGHWSSDGAQIGNVASALGVVGVWTTPDRDEGDPVGPFWLWKVDDDYPAHLMEYGT